MKLEELIGHLEKQCGDEDSFTVVFKEDKWPDIRRRIESKLEDVKDVAGVFIKGKYKDHEVSLFPTGRMIITGIKDEDMLISTRSELLS